MQLIRNFSIIAHIDHGKSTLADRFIQLCGGLEAREMQAQVLDSMDLERERGITIKAQSVTLRYLARDGETLPAQPDRHARARGLLLRSLALAGGLRRRAAGGGCGAGRRGAERRQLLHGARAGARSRAGAQQDRPAVGRPGKVIKEIEEIIGIEAEDAMRVSAKTGENVPELLEELVARIPPPQGRPGRAAAGADHRFLVRQLRGRRVAGARRQRLAARPAQKIRVMVDRPQRTRSTSSAASRRSRSPASRSKPGEVGFVIAGIKEIDGAPVGDTITLDARPASEPLPGFKTVQPRVFAGLFPVNSDDYENVPRRAARSSSSTTRRCITSRKSRPRSASASAAASSGCCTWTSCRSAWSASTT